MRNRRIAWKWVAGVTAGTAAAAGGTAVAAAYALGPDVRITGVADNVVLNGAQAAGRAVGVSGADLARARVRLNGRPVATRVENGRMVVRTGPLREGDYELTVAVPGRMGLPGGVRRSRFRVDATPPAVTVDGAAPAGQGVQVTARSARGPYRMTGRVADGVALTANGAPARLRDGRFALDFPYPPDAVRLSAVDAAGNRADLRVPVLVPHRPMRAVHVTALAWASKPLHDRVMRMVREGRINAVQLDIKDEDGIVGYRTRVPMAQAVKAVGGYYDAPAALAELHRAGVRVVGRIVAFRDPRLGRASWKQGARDRLVRTPGGAPYGSQYGSMSFTNVGNPQVRQYNIDLAREATALGFDDVLYDYVRRPDGPLAAMRFPGMRGTVEDAIAGFLADTHRAIRPLGGTLGASVYGIAATRPHEIGQDIAKMGAHVDYVAPMVYPSHWGPGEFGMADPDAHPYRTVRDSLRTFQKVLAGTPTQVVPWLQDFSMRHRYGSAEVREQIKALHAVGGDSYLMWDPAVRYHADALDERA
ncbi:putative glycoside hydrolase [Actinomadura parmotrematis]|uniref:Glycoside hydrolase n=1 Tax=Actinomadura parmotrematis TaxID=2864039 RepID=A0ABS7G107_9ACTN|nr:putative glycoside hydrolase [Actinomadura parmotrematis]MBW8486397.1 putative glycoside hydrolase [Actinomadura parmotrematis]